jgi:hypothetical protein
MQATVEIDAWWPIGLMGEPVDLVRSEGGVP